MAVLLLIVGGIAEVVERNDGDFFALTFQIDVILVIHLCQSVEHLPY